MKYAIVTGAASGMGKEYVRLLTSKGYGIVAIDINDNTLGTLAKEFAKYTVIPICCDLSIHDGADKAISLIRNACSESDIEILINNAGIFAYRNILSHPEGYIPKIITLHNITMAVLCRHYAATMASRGKGYILNISSLSAWMPYPGIAMYSATKRFTKDFSRALRLEIKGSGVSVTSAQFGGVATPMIPLPPKYMSLALRLHIMITPQKAAAKALEAMFRQRSSVTPGTINRIGKPFLAHCPQWILSIIDKKLSRFKRP